MKKKIITIILNMFILLFLIIVQSCVLTEKITEVSVNQNQLDNSDFLVQVVSPTLQNIIGDEKNWLGSQIQDKLKSNLQDYLRMRIVVDSKSENELKKIQEESESEAHDEKSAIEIGKISTAKYAVFSKVRKTNNGYFLSADFTDLTTGEQKASVTSSEYIKLELLYKNFGAVDEITFSLADKLGLKINDRHYHFRKDSQDSNYDILYCKDNEIYVKGGNFFIGSKEYFVNDFIIAKTEYADAAGFPIVNISWLDVIKFCNELSKKNSLDCVYEISKNEKNIKTDFSKNGYRLPTREEWYWAATGAENRDIVPLYNSSVWYLKNSGEKMHRVAQKQENSIGVYDMFGNAAEWCWNDAGDNCRIVCGGFYGNSEKYVSPSNFEIKHPQNSGENYIGFRLVRNCGKISGRVAK